MSAPLSAELKKKHGVSGRADSIRAAPCPRPRWALIGPLCRRSAPSPSARTTRCRLSGVPSRWGAGAAVSRAAFCCARPQGPAAAQARRGSDPGTDGPSAAACRAARARSSPSTGRSGSSTSSASPGRRSTVSGQRSGAETPAHFLLLGQPWRGCGALAPGFQCRAIAIVRSSNAARSSSNAARLRGGSAGRSRTQSPGSRPGASGSRQLRAAERSAAGQQHVAAGWCSPWQQLGRLQHPG